MGRAGGGTNCGLHESWQYARSSFTQYTIHICCKDLFHWVSILYSYIHSYMFICTGNVMINLLLHILYSYSDRDQLQTVYSAYLTPVLHRDLRSHPVWGSTARVHSLAGSMVSLYEQVQIIYVVVVKLTWFSNNSSVPIVLVLHAL